ncbi:MAG: hypothetical protein II336_18160 [Loktanella sp.]|nr:hypothetical protein [Loktanella sp.]
MNFRNATYNHLGTINCEIDHPKFGWIPFTASPDDVEALGRDIFATAQADAAPYVAPVIDPAEAIAAQKEAYRAAVQAHVDATARDRQYSDGASLAGYVASAHPAWRAEAETFIAWRDAVWIMVFDLLAEVQAGDAEPPESGEALVAMLPVIAWPGV